MILEREQFEKEKAEFAARKKDLEMADVGALNTGRGADVDI